MLFFNTFSMLFFNTFSITGFFIFLKSKSKPNLNDILVKFKYISNPL